MGIKDFIAKKILRIKEKEADSADLKKEISGKEILAELLTEIKKIPKPVTVLSSKPKTKTYEEQGMKEGDIIKQGEGKLKPKLIYVGRIR